MMREGKKRRRNSACIYFTTIDILCDDYSGKFTFRLRSYFLSFFTDQDVPQVTKGYVPEPDCLSPGFVVYFVNLLV